MGGIALATRKPALRRVREATAMIGRQMSRLRREKGITQVELPKRDKQALYRIMDSVLAKSGDVGENRRRTTKEVA